MKIFRKYVPFELYIQLDGLIDASTKLRYQGRDVECLSIFKIGEHTMVSYIENEKPNYNLIKFFEVEIEFSIGNLQDLITRVYNTTTRTADENLQEFLTAEINYENKEK